MCNVQILMILEGLEYCILSREGFCKSHPKRWKFPPYAFSYVMCFDVPPILCVWDIIKHFRGHLRVTNDNFHTHIHYCIIFYYYICHIDTYRNVEDPNFNNFGRFGILYFEYEGFCKTHPKMWKSFPHIHSLIWCVLMSPLW